METKIRKMRTAKTSVVLACLLTTFGLATAFGAELDDKCKQIKASGTTVTVTCSGPLGLCATGVVDGNHLIRGTTFATAFGIAPSAGLPSEPPSTVSVAGQRTISTPHGMLSFSFVSVFDTARGEFAEIDRVTGGTGGFDGATGTLWFTGTGITSFQFEITGEICTNTR